MCVYIYIYIYIYIHKIWQGPPARCGGWGGVEGAHMAYLAESTRSVCSAPETQEGVHGYLAHKKTPTPLGTPYEGAQGYLTLPRGEEMRLTWHTWQNRPEGFSHSAQRGSERILY